MVKIGKIILPDKPVLLAPMEDLTDPPFRRICRRYGADMVYTEFISSEGLVRDARKSLKKLDIYDDERPVGIQIFGHDINSMAKSADIAARANPDVLDINFGCPVKSVIHNGGGAALLLDVDKMIAMAAAVVKNSSVPVTAKTRLGWDEKNKNVVDVAERLQDVGIQAIAIHGRTRMQLYQGKADWTLIGEVKNNPRMKIPVIGNGDIDCGVKAKEMFDRYGVDGIMVGRAATGNPWIFREIKTYLQKNEITEKPGIEERAELCKEHLKLSAEWKGEHYGIIEMRKHFSKYFRGVPSFKKYRIELLTSDSVDYINGLLTRICYDFNKMVL